MVTPTLVTVLSERRKETEKEWMKESKWGGYSIHCMFVWHEQCCKVMEMMKLVQSHVTIRHSAVNLQYIFM
jgi:hypothetical protein